MKKLFAELTDINGTKHVANLSTMDDAPVTMVAAKKLLTHLPYVEDQDGNMLNMDHVVVFKIKEVEQA